MPNDRTSASSNSASPANDASLAARDLAVLWHPASQMRDYRDFPPLEVVAAQGCRLRLADGREILDAISSWWCKALGHGHPKVLAAMIAQAERFEHVILANTTNEPIVRLCERLLAMANGFDASHWGPSAPSGRAAGHYGKVFFADNGSTAVEIAMKMALQAQAQRGAPQRTRFAAFRNGYHGETAGAMSVGDYDVAISPFKAMLFPVTFIDGLPYRTGPDDPRWLDASDAWPAMQRQLDVVADKLAAVIYEPVLQGAGGMRLYSPAVLPRLRAWADANDVYLIADEIATGFGRLGAMLASFLSDPPPSEGCSDPPPLREGLGEGEACEAFHTPVSASDLQQSTISNRQSSVDSGSTKDSQTSPSPGRVAPCVATRPPSPSEGEGADSDPPPLRERLGEGEKPRRSLRDSTSAENVQPIPIANRKSQIANSFADFLVISKGLTAGVTPLSAVLTTDAVYDLFDADYLEGKAFMHSNTYTGHALGVAAALATLDAFVEENVHDHVGAHGSPLREDMQRLAAERPYLFNARGCGFVAAVDIRQHDGSPIDRAHRTGYRVYREAVKRGALLRPLGDTMYLFPPLNTPGDDLERMLAILAESLDAVMG